MFVVLELRTPVNQPIFHRIPIYKGEWWNLEFTDPPHQWAMVMHQVFIGRPLGTHFSLFKALKNWCILIHPPVTCVFFADFLVTWRPPAVFPRSQPSCGKSGFQCGGAGGSALGRVGFHRSSQRADLPISQGGRALEKEAKCEIFGIIVTVCVPYSGNSYHCLSSLQLPFFDAFRLLNILGLNKTSEDAHRMKMKRVGWPRKGSRSSKHPKPLAVS